MGLPTTSKLRDAARKKPKQKSGGYIRDPETQGQLLRPDWAVSFTDNSGWHKSAIAFFRQKIPLQNPAISQAIIAKKSDQEILTRIGAIFKSIAAQYKKLQEMDAAADDDEDDEDDADEGPEEKQLGRHKSRKSRVSAVVFVCVLAKLKQKKKKNYRNARSG